MEGVAFDVTGIVILFVLVFQLSIATPTQAHGEATPHKAKSDEKLGK